MAIDTVASPYARYPTPALHRCHRPLHPPHTLCNAGRLRIPGRRRPWASTASRSLVLVGPCTSVSHGPRHSYTAITRQQSVCENAPTVVDLLCTRRGQCTARTSETGTGAGVHPHIHLGDGGVHFERDGVRFGEAGNLCWGSSICPPLSRLGAYRIVNCFLILPLHCSLSSFFSYCMKHINYTYQSNFHCNCPMY
ncbi:hypothetical protein HYPSUDRAFT_528994 [Hypholoma sublateritium FD-334 SS-4]|uniref:Uncharacterized protein n=1 Tax=Hypholoma sublateritium (strain FD-334 SS-4) TaxID=945553 RepID=A0A0D2MKY4_HYPSF|nr:hypothetical protein HYPSUDRAFT_528994 [Hypholoma sublateritium FD-334 SS-4]